MGVQPSYGELVALATKAMESGCERMSLARFKWDISGGCEAPVGFDLWARPDAEPDNQDLLSAGVRRDFRRALIREGLMPATTVRGFAWSIGRNHALGVELTVRCRKCGWCRAARAREWRLKAELETKRAPRTWFCTFTLRPDEQFRAESMARDIDANTGGVFELRGEDDQFRKVCSVVGQEITRFVKRVRKESGVPLRYLFVTERHKSGLPHWHALIHEVNPAQPLRKAVLKGQWKLGHSHVKLAEPSAARYLCKYLSKDLATRVRSSLNYGVVQPTCVHSSFMNVRCDPKDSTVIADSMYRRASGVLSSPRYSGDCHLVSDGGTRWDIP